MLPYIHIYIYIPFNYTGYLIPAVPTPRQIYEPSQRSECHLLLKFDHVNELQTSGLGVTPWTLKVVPLRDFGDPF